MSRLVQLLVSSFVCRNHSGSMRFGPHDGDIQEQGSVFRRYSQSLDSPTNYLVESARLASLPKFSWSGGSKLSQRAAEAMREQNVTARLATCGLISLQKSQQIKKIRFSLWVSFASARSTCSGQRKHSQSCISGMPGFEVYISLNAMNMLVWWKALDLLEVAFLFGGKFQDW